MVKLVLSNQKSTDYRPKEDDASLFANNASTTCLEIVNFIKARRDVMARTLDGKNIELISEELGYRIFKWEESV